LILASKVNLPQDYVAFRARRLKQKSLLDKTIKDKTVPGKMTRRLNLEEVILL
jgi:hypothetical protein